MDRLPAGTAFSASDGGARIAAAQAGSRALRAFGMIGAALLAATLGATLAGGEGRAQAPGGGGESLNLLCIGSDSVLVTRTPSLQAGRAFYLDSLSFGEGRASAQLGVMVQDGRVTVKPPRGSVPMFAKGGKDGWYELTNASVDRLSIKGRMKWNRIDRWALSIDRRSGAATFGDFTGVCQRASASPDATKF